MATTLLCLNNVKGIGGPCDNMTPITLLQGLALLRPGFTFEDAVDIALLASWQTAIAEKNVMIVNEIISQESIKVEDGKHTTPFGQIIHLWDGMRGLSLKVKLTLEQHKILRTYAAQGWDLIRIDKSNTIIGVLNDDETVGGFSLATFIVESQTEPLIDTPPLTPVIFQEDDPGEYNAKGCWLKPSWRVSKLKPLTYLTIEATAVAAFKFSLTVYWLSDSKFDESGLPVKVPYSGALAANFRILDQAGAVEVCTVEESDSLPGTYEFTGIDLTGGSAQIIPAYTNLYESAVVPLT